MLEWSIRKIIFPKKKIGLMIANMFRITGGYVSDELMSLWQ